MFAGLPLIQPVRRLGYHQLQHVRRGGEEMKSKKSRPTTLTILKEDVQKRVEVEVGEKSLDIGLLKQLKNQHEQQSAAGGDGQTSSSKSTGRKFPTYRNFTHAEIITKWVSDHSWRRRLITLWKTIPVNEVNFDKLSEGKKIFDQTPVFAVDSSKFQGGGVLFVEDMQICYVYKVNFFKDLNIGELQDPSIFEMLNFLLGLFIFKKKLVNLKEIRVINDNNKIRSAKGNNLVAAIHQIFRWLQEVRGLNIINNREDNFNLTVRPEDGVFVRYADSLSKNKPFDYPDSWSEIQVVAISKKEMMSSLKDLMTELWNV